MLIEVNWNPDTKQLRSFGLVAGAAAVILAGYARLAKGLAMPWSVAILVLGLLIAANCIFLPTLGRYIYRIFVAVTLPIGLTLSLLLMTLFYLCLITPMAIVFRLIDRDSLCRRFDPKASSYWIQRKIEMEKERYFQQF